MTRVEPKVFLIGYTAMDVAGIYDWMEHVGGGACLRHISGEDAEQIVELAARRCYRSFDVGLNPNVTKVRRDSQQYHENILKQAHGSVMAHASATWAFEDVSRVFTHELCRNMIGIKSNDSNDDLAVAEFGLSQESMRYVRLDDIRVWLPPEFEEDEFCKQTVLGAIEYLEQAQKKLIEAFRLDEMDFDRKKKVTSALRRMLPMGIGTGIVWTSNFRALRWVLEQRTAPSAEHEIRIVFDQVARIASKKWLYLFGDFKQTGSMEWEPKYRKV